MAMPKHGVRLILLLILFFASAVGARYYLKAPSFYEYGHYRANSVPEIAAPQPQYRGPSYCQTCHADRHTAWSAGVHKVVKCEVCHGAAKEHPQSGKLAIPTDTVRLCTLCHEAMPGRPAAQPQIEVAQHAGGQQCVTCHNPHSPKIGAPAATQATTAPTAATAAPVDAQGLTAKCTGCHGADGLGVGTFPALAGKDADYLAKQLRDYKSGARPNPMMATIAKSLSEQDIADLAAFYASLKRKTTQ
ncbi:MAG: c-type cytochrome [Acidiferrobacterales bacterium]|nr:c-type cytochrome [Acidiferrobacterales bacterium]